MPTTEPNPEMLRAAERIVPADQPVFMVNLLRYKPQADYGAEGTDLPPCSGREAYLMRYAATFNQLAAGTGIKAYWLGRVLANVLAPESEERWDDVGIVEYPNLAAFRKITESAAYKDQAEPHRRAALADLRLIATDKVELPG